MGFFGPSSHTSHHSTSYPHRSSSTPAGYYTRPSRPSYARSTSSFFSRASGGGGGSSSYYKRRPRDGYIAYLVHKLKRLVRDLWAYARRHPVKAFLAVVVPLISAGGALSGLLGQLGVRLPMGIGSMGGMGGRGGGGYYRSSGYGGYGREEFGGGGMMGGLGSVMKIAQAFM